MAEGPAVDPSRRVSFDVVRTTLVYLTLAVTVGVLYTVLRPLIKDGPLYLWIRHQIYYPSIESIGAIFTNPILYVGLAVVLLLERLFPAKSDQPQFSVGLAQDAVFLAVVVGFETTALAAYASFLRVIYNEHLQMLTIESVQALPLAASLMLGILVSDFLGWFHHWVRHKVPLLWEFHTVHHSQRELNIFTDTRYHMLEYLFSKTIVAFPLMMFSVDYHGITLILVVHIWFTRLYHGNIRSNFGVLRYVFVTPQSHRVHHSIEERHWNKNFGVLLSIWDRMFGTQYDNCDEYPDTGVHDDHFPLERSIGGLNLLLTPVRQHIYPFRTVFGWLARK